MKIRGGVGQKSTAFDYYIHRNRNIRFNNMLHYTYRIDNLINGKYYIGKHSSESLDDGYMGSGPLIKAAIAKYGIDNFKKTILKTFPTSEEAFEHEAQIVTMTEVNDPMCYNVQPGGRGRQKLFTDVELRERKLERQREYDQQNKERILEYHKEYNQQNKERILEQLKGYYQQNKGRYRERMKEYYQQNKEQYRERQKEHYQQNKERILEYHKEHYQQNKERCRERMKEHYQQNKEQYRERQKEYYQQNKEQQREYKREYMKEYRRKKREQKQYNISIS